MTTYKYTHVMHGYGVTGFFDGRHGIILKGDYPDIVATRKNPPSDLLPSGEPSGTIDPDDLYTVLLSAKKFGAEIIKLSPSDDGILASLNNEEYGEKVSKLHGSIPAVMGINVCQLDALPYVNGPIKVWTATGLMIADGLEGAIVAMMPSKLEDAKALVIETDYIYVAKRYKRLQFIPPTNQILREDASLDPQQYAAMVELSKRGPIAYRVDGSKAIITHGRATLTMPITAKLPPTFTAPKLAGTWELIILQIDGDNVQAQGQSKHGNLSPIVKLITQPIEQPAKVSTVATIVAPTVTAVAELVAEVKDDPIIVGLRAFCKHNPGNDFSLSLLHWVTSGKKWSYKQAYFAKYFARKMATV